LTRRYDAFVHPRREERRGEKTTVESAAYSTVDEPPTLHGDIAAPQVSMRGPM
jgi:hypothetical protein